MVKLALSRGQIETTAIMTISRAFLLRVPSGALPLQWRGRHSTISLLDDVATITLARRKNSLTPVAASRKCTCDAAPPLLCAVHWLQRLHEAGPYSDQRLFAITKNGFATAIKTLAKDVGFPDAEYVGTHSFRRGMAQNVLDNGGTLATLLKAGDWNSKAFQVYLRDTQLQDTAVSNLVISISDSEDEDI